MEIIEIIFTWGVPLLVIFLFYGAKGEQVRLNRLFRELARETGGTMPQSSWFRYPELTVHHHNCHFTLGNGVAGKVWVTKLYLDNHMKAPFQLRIQPTDKLEEFSKKLGFQDVELGNPRFDAEYLVKTQDTSRARALIDSDLQQLLVELRPLRPELWISEHTINVRTQMQYEIEGYRKLLKLGYKLCEAQQKANRD